MGTKTTFVDLKDFAKYDLPAGHKVAKVMIRKEVLDRFPHWQNRLVDRQDLPTGGGYLGKIEGIPVEVHIDTDEDFRYLRVMYEVVDGHE